MICVDSVEDVGSLGIALRFFFGLVSGDSCDSVVARPFPFEVED